MPEGVEDRDADIWEALLAVADLAGARWAMNAHVSAVTLVTASKRRQPSLGITLLHDIRRVFNRAGIDKLTTDGVISGLRNTPDSPWSRIRKGEPIDPTYLAGKLRDYDIRPKAQRVKDDVFKGYSRAQFEDAWKRYPLPVEDGDEDQE